MMSTYLFAAGMIGSLMMPLAAHAYVMPEEVLDEGDFSTRFFEPPPSRRDMEAVAEEQRLRSAQRREAEQAAIMPQPEPTEEVMRGAAPEQSMSDSDIQKLIDAIQQLQESGNSSAAETDSVPSSENMRDQRALERIKVQREAAEAAEREAYYRMLVGDSTKEALHSGAPLSETGPATVLITLAIAGAIAETYRRVRKSEGKL